MAHGAVANVPDKWQLRGHCGQMPPAQALMGEGETK